MSEKIEDKVFYGASMAEPEEAIELIRLGWKCRDLYVPHLLGGPGIGKTEVVYEAARRDEKESGEKCVVVTRELSQMDQFDVMGALIVEDREIETESGFRTMKITDFAPPVFFPRAGRGYLFFDEFSRANKDVQNVVMNLLLYRKMGDYTLPEKFSIVLASNIGDSFQTNDIDDPAHISRQQFIHMKLTAPKWLSWYKKQECMHPVVYDFISNKPNFLYDDKGFNARTSFATPRDWVKMGSVLNRLSGTASQKQLLQMFSGYIGKANASIFLDFIAQQDDSIPLEKVLYSYASVAKDVQHLRTSSKASVMADLIKSVAIAVVERCVDPEEMKNILPNLSAFMCDLPDERIVSLLHEVRQLVGDDDKFMKRLNRELYDLSPEVGKRTIDVLSRINKID